MHNMRATAADTLSAGASTALERPLFHFTPRFGWTNDPNGLNWQQKPNGDIVQHLYYQANPNSTASPWNAKAGPAMCPAWWGHAISTFGKPGDLVRWTEVRSFNTSLLLRLVLRNKDDHNRSILLGVY